MTEQYQDKRLSELMKEFMSDVTIELEADEEIVHIENAPYQDGNEEIYELYDIQNEEIESLRNQMHALNDEIILQRESNAQNNSTLEISLLKEKYNTHTNKIENLEYKQRILKADVKLNAEKKVSGFGTWGKVFLVSNVLLWSMFGWFFWEHYAGDFIDQAAAESTYGNNDQYLGLDEVKDNNYVTAPDKKSGESIEDNTTTEDIFLEQGKKEFSDETTKQNKQLTKTNSAENSTLDKNKLTDNVQAAPVQKNESKVLAKKEVAKKESTQNEAALNAKLAIDIKKQPIKSTRPETKLDPSKPALSEDPPIRFGD